MNAERPRWKYKADEVPKKKHAWPHSYAGFVIVDGVEVGKCPKGFDLEEAERLINDGIPFFPKRWNTPYPKRIYVVHDGVLYRAEITNPGESYHAFPESPEGFNKLPTTVREKVLRRADELGQLKQVRKWLNA